eukprot:gene39729-52432_t
MTSVCPSESSSIEVPAADILTRLKQFKLKKTLFSGDDGSVTCLGYFDDDLQESKPAIVKVRPLAVNTFRVEGDLLQDALRSLKLELKTESGSRFSNYDGFDTE